MQEEEHKKRIYEYCDNNINEKVYFLAFNNLWVLPEQITPQNLATLTSGIVSDLVKQKIIIEIPKKLETFHPMYKVLPHEKLIDD